MPNLLDSASWDLEEAHWRAKSDLFRYAKALNLSISEAQERVSAQFKLLKDEPKSMKLIAICGLANSGKTTLAKHLCEHAGYTILPLAYPIKAMISRLLELQSVPARDIDSMLYGNKKDIPTEFLGSVTPRRAMQTLGTEWRDLIHPNLWLNIWARQIKAHFKVVCDDLRFLYEADRIRTLGGIIVKTIRNEVYTTADSHSSENEYLKIKEDILINNSYSKDAMYDLLEVFLGDKL